jgi:hypothetical protein
MTGDFFFRRGRNPMKRRYIVEGKFNGLYVRRHFHFIKPALKWAVRLSEVEIFATDVKMYVYGTSSFYEQLTKARELHCMSTLVKCPGHRCDVRNSCRRYLEPIRDDGKQVWAWYRRSEELRKGKDCFKDMNKGRQKE